MGIQHKEDDEQKIESFLERIIELSVNGSICVNYGKICVKTKDGYTDISAEDLIKHIDEIGTEIELNEKENER